MSQKIKERLTEAGPRGARILRLPRVCDRTGLSGPTIYRLIGEGRFPRQVPLSSIAVGWVESEVEAWLDARITAREPAAVEVVERSPFVRRTSAEARPT